MKTTNSKVYILGSARTPFVKSQTAYSNISRKDLMTASLNGLVSNYKLEGKFIDDTALGAVMNSSSDFNLARECILSTKLAPESPAYNVQRACGTGLEATWQIALKASTGAIDLGIAGGVDSNSDLPIEVSQNFQRVLLDLNKAKTFTEKVKIFSKLKAKDMIPQTPVIDEPRTRLSMGAHCELMVKEWKISREQQDEFSLLSHQNASKAINKGFFEDLIIPFNGIVKDGFVRPDTTLEKLSKLKPAFDFVNGSLTAGNSSPLTDGSACALIANENGVSKLNIKPLAELIDVQCAAVDFVQGAGLLMAPTKAVSQLLLRNGITFQDIDFFEIHEAFAGQVLCNLKAWESDSYCKNVLGLKSALGKIDGQKLNVVGSSVSMGHPFAATGARIVGTLAKLLSNTGKKRGIISICTAGGMGIAALMESV